MKSNLCFSLVIHAYCIISNKLLLNLRLKRNYQLSARMQIIAHKMATLGTW